MIPLPARGQPFPVMACHAEIRHNSALYAQLVAKLSGERVQLRWLAHHITREGLSRRSGRIDRIFRYELGTVRDQKVDRIVIFLRAFEPARNNNMPSRDHLHGIGGIAEFDIDEQVIVSRLAAGGKESGRSRRHLLPPATNAA